MNPSSSWLYRYPFLRFDIPLIAGIVLGGAGWHLRGWPLTLCMVTGVALLCLGAAPISRRISKLGNRWLFGAVLMVTLCLTGMWRMDTRYREVAVEWPREKQAWQGWVTGFSQEKKNSRMIPVEVEGKLIYLYLPKDSLSAALQCGDKIFFHTAIRKPINRGDAREFDYAAYLYRNGISGTAYAGKDSWKKGSTIRPLTLKQKALQLRSVLVDKYQLWGFDERELGVVAALTLGDKSHLDDSIREDYSTAGTSHVLALSGLHMSIVVTVLGTLLLLTPRSGRNLWSRCLLLIALLWAFAFITGLSGSVVRSAVMFSIVLMGRCLRRRGRVVNSLAFAAFVMLVYNPFYLYDVGFQMSFLAIVGIVAFNPLLLRFKKETKWRWLNNVQDTVCTSISAQLGVWPLVAYYFGNFPLYFIPANLLIIPLSFVSLSFSLAVWGVSVFPFLSGLHSLMVTVLQFCLQLQNGIVSFVGHLPLASLPVECSLPMLWLAYWLTLCLWTGWKYKRLARPAIAALCGFCLLLAGNIGEQMADLRPTLLFYTDRSQRDVIRFSHRGEALHIDSVAARSGIIPIAHTHVCVLEDKDLDFSQVSSPLPLAVLYIRKEYEGDFLSAASAFKVTTVVMEASVRYRIRKKIEDYCARNAIRLIDLGETGACRLEV